MTVPLGRRMERVSERLIAEAEAKWRAAQIEGYHITVDVIRGSDVRRNDVTVHRGAIIYATVRYRESDGRFGEPRELTTAQAEPFTIEGLFELLRDEMLRSGRIEIRVERSGTPPLPRTIELGPLLRKGKVVPDTAVLIHIVRFEQEGITPS
ncbi:MAG: hypothetical protein D6812_00830 [Deltaproteobacteria bacterium]|nr:MAG: hypothetical protein D6812_00830 [Deltaproteobacteria bacterium]